MALQLLHPIVGDQHHNLLNKMIIDITHSEHIAPGDTTSLVHTDRVGKTSVYVSHTRTPIDQIVWWSGVTMATSSELELGGVNAGEAGKINDTERVCVWVHTVKRNMILFLSFVFDLC